MKRPAASGEREAQARFGTAKRAAAFCANQQLDHLNDAMRQFIARQEMMSIATSDAAGRCDCSFRAGEPGFVQVLNSKTLAYPEYRGNGVLASVGNILENPHIGMIFLDYCDTRSHGVGSCNHALDHFRARRPHCLVLRPLTRHQLTPLSLRRHSSSIP